MSAPGACRLSPVTSSAVIPGSCLRSLRAGPWDLCFALAARLRDGATQDDDTARFREQVGVDTRPLRTFIPGMSPPTSRTYTACVITVSTRIAAGQREDSSGAILRNGLAQLGLTVADGGVIPDDRLTIQRSALRLCDFEPVALLVFTGGTGPTPDDVTTEALMPLLERRFEGIENALHDDWRGSTPRAPMSRLLAGARGKTAVVALPGSPGACKDALLVLEPFLTHLLSLSAGTFDPH